MTYDPSSFHHSTPITSSPIIHTADGSLVIASYIGYSINNYIKITNALSLPDVFLIPKLSMNLLSVGQLCDLGLNVIFSSSGCIIQDHLTKKQIGTGRKVGRLYAVDKLHIPCSPITSLFASPTPTCTPFMSWHSRLGHISFSRLRYMFNKRLLDQSKIDKEPCYVTCRLAKQPALPFNNSTTSFSSPL
ncbi:unnamed protein product [Prunus brigantina]